MKPICWQCWQISVKNSWSLLEVRFYFATIFQDFCLCCYDFVYVLDSQHIVIQNTWNKKIKQKHKQFLYSPVNSLMIIQILDFENLIRLQLDMRKVSGKNRGVMGGPENFLNIAIIFQVSYTKWNFLKQCNRYKLNLSMQ